MKKKKFIILILLIVSITMFTFSTVFATDTDDSDLELIINEDEEIGEFEEDNNICNSDLYVMYGESEDDTYFMDYYVEGNAFIIADKVEITGQINGSLFILANELTIDEDAYVTDTIYAIVDTFTLNGFAYDIYAVADTFNTGEEALIYRDAKILASDLYLRGVIGRNLITYASTIDVYDEENALYIGGNLEYSSLSEIENIDNITVGGEITFTLIEESDETTGDIIYSYIYSAAQNIIYTLVIYLVILFVAPKFIEKSKEYVNTRMTLAGAIGLCFTILMPIIAILLLFITGGFGLFAIMLIVYAIILMVNSTVVNAIATEYLSEKINWIDNIWKKLLMFVLVSLVMFILRQIPYIGTIVTIIIFLVGVGVPILYQFDKRSKKEVAK